MGPDSSIQESLDEEYDKWSNISFNEDIDIATTKVQLKNIEEEKIKPKFKI